MLPTIQLHNGCTTCGSLCDSADPDTLRWQVPGFASPFDFQLKGVDFVNFAAPPNRSLPSGNFCFELVGGDVFFGSLLGVRAQEVEIDAASFGRVHLRRKALHRISKEGGGLVYLGPNGVSDWKTTPNVAAWRSEQGCLITTESGASLESTFDLPSRAAVELEISWYAKPDFVLTFGSGPDPRSASQAFRLEAWQRDVVVLRETERQADLASVHPLAGNPKRIHLRIYIDDDAGRCLVYSNEGKRLADIRVPRGSAPRGTHLRVTNKRGSLQLERIRIDQWTDTSPPETGIRKSRLYLNDGSSLDAEIVGFDLQSNEFLLQGNGPTRLSTARFMAAVLRAMEQGSAPPSGPSGDNKPDLILRTTSQDSTRLSGRLMKVEGGAVWLSSTNFHEQLRLPIKGLRSLSVDGGAEIVPVAEQQGTFEGTSVRLTGRLIDAHKTSTASCLVFLPEGSVRSSALRGDAAGKITFRKGTEAVSGANPTARRTISHNGSRDYRPAQTASVPLNERALYLNTGDAIPCEVVGITPGGVTIKSAAADFTLIPHDKMKAVELTDDGRGPVALTKSKRDRLLTLPRMQKNNPPTQLIRSRDGDYLRGRIVQMDQEKAVVEVRLETKEIPRERISRIIWLHPEETAGVSATASKPRLSSGLRVQVVRADGTRLTFQPDRLAGSMLSGKHDVLGPCRADLSNVEELYIGASIEQAVTRAAYQQWKLQLAVEPRFLHDSGGDGQESALVGKPAPDFELELLDGKRFHLQDSKGKIVVVEFWATWCIGCLQSMPRLVQVHRDFGGHDIVVVAVNMEETPQQIRPVLERHKWQIPVALDRDANVAIKYQVTALPQTIVVDRDGKVSRHFFGGDPKHGKQLVDCLQGLLTSRPSH